MNESSHLYVAFVAAVVIPLMFQSWRVALIGLGVQGLLLGAIVSSHNHLMSAQLVFEYGYLFVLRGVVLPVYFFRHHGKHKVHDDFVLIRKNLFGWMVAGSLVCLAFIFSQALSPENVEEAALVGTAATALLIGMLILSNQADTFGEIIGLFTIESGISLIELLSPHAIPFPVHIGIACVFVLLMLTCGKYLEPFSTELADISSASSEPESIDLKIQEN